MPPALIMEFFAYLPPEARPVVLSAGESTYRSGVHASEIDFFVADPRFASFTEKVRIMHEVPVSPHFAVAISLIPNPHQCRVLAQVRVPRIATRRILGPFPKPRETKAEDERWEDDLWRCSADEMYD